MRIEPQPTLDHLGEKKLNLLHVPEKLTEAQFCLAKMIERERQLTGEPFKSYLDAFLMFAMAVRDPFDGKALKDQREKWKESLTPDEARIWDAMREARKDEAHIARKSRPAKPRRRTKPRFKQSVDQEEIKVGIGSSHSDRSGRVEGYGSPAIHLGLGINSTVFTYRDIHYFDIDGQKRKVTELCSSI